jgi:hypothetical protein
MRVSAMCRAQSPEDDLFCARPCQTRAALRLPSENRIESIPARSIQRLKRYRDTDAQSGCDELRKTRIAPRRWAGTQIAANRRRTPWRNEHADELKGHREVIRKVLQQL